MEVGLVVCAKLGSKGGFTACVVIVGRRIRGLNDQMAILFSLSSCLSTLKGVKQTDNEHKLVDTLPQHQKSTYKR